MKRQLRQHLERLRKIERKKHHPLLHHVHKKHRISRKTLFYVKEYGPHTHVPRTIIRESIKILLFASVISSFGGLALEQIKPLFISIIPLIVLLPALNDMIGDYGTIVSAKFSTMLHEGETAGKATKNRALRKLFIQIFILSMITAVFGSALALTISSFSGYASGFLTAAKIFVVAVIDVALLVSVLFGVSVAAGTYFYNKGEDPNNFLIPITTSVADFGNMLILAALVLLLF